MEVYRAVSDFAAPSEDSNILSFSKGDTFEVFDSQKKTDWWGARRLNDNAIGYVPSKYLQYAERQIGKLLPENYHEHREKHLEKFVAMQNSDQHKHPAVMLADIPTPDYDPDMPVAHRSSFVFVEKFRDVITNIRTIEELYSEIPEPDPDYQNDEDTTDFPPPPPELEADDTSFKEVPATSPTSTAKPTIIGVKNGGVSSPEDKGPIVQPRKLSNPCVESKERQALHRELLMNYRLGKDILKKPELDKALQKRKDAQKRKEWEEQQANKRTSLELKLEERANKLKEDDAKMKTISEDKEEQQPELLRMHRRITTKTQAPPT